MIGSTLGNNFLVFSLQMSHFGLTPAQGESRVNINMRSVTEYYYAEDNCYYFFDDIFHNGCSYYVFIIV